MRNVFIGSRKGFSLIELMIVVIIMGILAAGASVIASKNSEKAKYAQGEKDLDTILSALGSAYSASGSFGTVTTGKTLDAAFTGTFKTQFEAQLSRSLSDLTDPWGNAYFIYSTYDDSTKAGVIKVYCSPSSTAIGGDPSSGARVNTFNNSRKMYRQVFNGA